VIKYSPSGNLPIVVSTILFPGTVSISFRITLPNREVMLISASRSIPALALSNFGLFCPRDFFKLDLKDDDIDEILEIHEDLIDYKPVIGINTGATFEHFELGIYKLK
jgi:hypothetical protein